MLSLERLHSVTGADFLRTGLAHSPYCSANELLLLTHLSQAALGKERLRAGVSAVSFGEMPVPRALAVTVSLPWAYYGYGTYGGLSISSTMPETQGMIMGYNVSGLRHANRHFYGDLQRPPYSSHDRGHRTDLTANLEQLGLKYPDKDSDAVTTLMALIALNHLKPGKYFESNIRTATEWFKSTHPTQAHYYW